MKDFKYILKSVGVGLGIVTFAFIFDLSHYYESNWIDGARYLFSGDIYSLTYYGTLVLFVIVLWQLWETINEALVPKQRFIPFWGSFILVIIISFCPIFTLFRWITCFLLLAIMLHLGIQQKNKHE